MEFKKLALATFVAAALAGCGGDDSSDNTPVTTPPTGEQPVDPPAATFKIKAIDGYLKDALVKVDEDNDLTNGCETIIGLTDKDGTFDVPAKYQDAKLCIKAMAGETVDTSRGIVQDHFELRAPASSDIISPMTDLVVDQMEADPSLSQANAEAEVVSALGASEEIIFGDYVAIAEGDDQEAAKIAQGVNVVGETLVDVDTAENDLSPEEQLIIAGDVADEAATIIKIDGELENYSPAVDVPPKAEDGSRDITVEENHRPYISVDAEITDYEIELGDILTIETSGWFVDDDSHDHEEILKYTMGIEGTDKNGLKINVLTGEITGKPKNAGSFDVHVYATDPHEARSYPASFNLKVTAPNLPPVMQKDVRADIQAEVGSLNLKTGEEVNESVSIDGLFTDADDDQLTYRVEESISGLDISVTGETLQFSGMPNRKGEFEFNVFATDGVYDEVVASFSLVVEQGAFVAHPLEDTTWYWVDHGSSDGDGDSSNDYTRNWCNTLRFENNEVQFVPRSIDQQTSCSSSEDKLDVIGSYTVDGEVLTATFDDGKELNYSLITDQYKNAGMGVLISQEEIDTADESEAQSDVSAQVYFANKQDAEKRITLDAYNEVVTAYLPTADGTAYKQVTLTFQQDDDWVEFAIEDRNSETGFRCSEFLQHYQLPSVSSAETIDYRVEPWNYTSSKYGENYCSVTMETDENPDGAPIELLLSVISEARIQSESIAPDWTFAYNYKQYSVIDDPITPPAEKAPAAAPATDLEGTIWYSLNTGNNDGDGNKENDFSRIWCDSMQFEGGVIYSNARTLDNRTQCTTEGLVDSGIYEIEGDRLIATWIEGEREYLGEYTIIANQYQEQGAGILVTWSEQDDEGVDLSTDALFDDKAAVEARIQHSSLSSAQDFPIYLATSVAGEYELGYYFLDALEYDEWGGFEQKITFRNASNEKGMSCTSLQSYFGQAWSLRAQADDKGVSSDLDYDSDNKPMDGIYYRDECDVEVGFKFNRTAEVGDIVGIYIEERSALSDFMPGILINAEWAGEYYMPEEPVEPTLPASALENNTWYVLESGNSDGDENSEDFNRVWCDTWKFEGDKVYLNTRTSDNMQTCSTDADVQVGTYSVDGDVLVVNDASSDKTYNWGVLSDQYQNDGAGLLVQFTESNDSSDKKEAYAYFATAEEAQARLTLKSDKRSNGFAVYLPTATAGNYDLGRVVPGIWKEDKEDHPYEGDLDLEVEIHNDTSDAGLTCGQALAVFSSYGVSVSGDNFGEFQFAQNPYTDTDDDDYGKPYCVVDLDPRLGEAGDTEKTYSVGAMGFADDDYRSFIPSILMNIEWTGKSYPGANW